MKHYLELESPWAKDQHVYTTTVADVTILVVQRVHVIRTKQQALIQIVNITQNVKVNIKTTVRLMDNRWAAVVCRWVF